MAYSKIQKDLSASILAGSEEMFDFYCDPCSTEKHVEAVGYCQQCSEYLCITCINYHGKLSATRQHTILDKSAMPKTKVAPKNKSIDVITEMCRKHPGKVLEYFCKDHNQICCSVCLTLGHNSCLDKSYVPDESTGVAYSREYTSITTDIDRLITEIKKRQEMINSGDQNNEKYRSKALADIQAFRKQINELLDQIEEDTREKVLTLHQENADLIRDASEKCQILLTDVESMAANMGQNARTGKNNQLFVQMKLSYHHMAEVEKRLTEIDACKITRYSFHQDENLQRMMSTLSTIWSLSMRKDGTPPRHARYVQKVNVKSDDDTQKCDISGIVVLDKDRTVVSDYVNKAIKLIDMKEGKVTSRLSMPFEPLDITKINKDQVAVTLKKEEKVQIVAVSDRLQRRYTIDTPDARITGLCYDGSKFIVSCQLPAKVKIIEMSGTTLNSFSTNDHGEKLFTKPRCIALGCDGNVVYVSDCTGNTVTCMSLSGHVISIYKHYNLIYPAGVVAGKHGVMYVCSRRSHTVHQLSPNGDVVFLGESQGLEAWPNAIAYDEEDDVLYISNSSADPDVCNSIRLYQLK